ncbi:NADH-quinone oxidoreductase subunit N [Amorphus sp. 3PC139-8]|uniref:NADH-quinone oxidoreductase subunit N n=1 Tax=Amorphus sp. 3PC139-8 TaxID=2735676 RepID=UPI00345D7F63
MPLGDILPEIAVLLTAVAVLLAATFLPRDRQAWCAWLALVGIAVSLLLCTMQVGSSRLTFSGVWALDGASTWARLMILATTAVALGLSPDWVKTDRRHGEFYAVLLFSCLGAMALAGASDLMQVVMGALLSSVTGYTLAAYHRDWGTSVEAGMKYFLVGALANTVMVTGVVLMLGMAGTTDFAKMETALGAGASAPLLMLGFGLVVVGLAFKLGAVPAHAWMPDVAEAAPVPAAAFLTVAPKIGAAIALARLVDLFPTDAFAIRPVIAVLSVLTMTLGNLAALWQDDVRRLIGWSSVSQSGYALMAVTVVGLTEQAIPALLFFLLGYAAANLAAFAVVGHLRGRTDRRDYAGLAATRPVAATILVLSFLSLVGIPPLAGFVGKLELFVATIEGGYAWLAIVAIANTVASLFYYLRVIGPLSFGKAEGSQPQILGRWSSACMTIGGASIVVLGLAAGTLLALFQTASLLPVTAS